MSFTEKYRDAEGHYRQAVKRDDGSAAKAGKTLRELALERAERREWAHKRHGTEERFNE